MAYATSCRREIDINRNPKGLSFEYNGVGRQCANGQIGWLGSNGRPDFAAAHSIIAGEYKNKSPQLITWCNQTITQCKSTEVKHCIWPIKVDDLRIVVDTQTRPSTPRGRDINKGGSSDLQISSWTKVREHLFVSIALLRSRKLPRKAGSPQLVETHAASYGAADCNSVKCLLSSVLYSDYSIYYCHTTTWALEFHSSREEVHWWFLTMVSEGKIEKLTQHDISDMATQMLGDRYPLEVKLRQNSWRSAIHRCEGHA